MRRFTGGDDQKRERLGRNHILGQQEQQVGDEVLENKALELSEEAKRLAEHAGRKTITDKDIHLANK